MLTFGYSAGDVFALLTVALDVSRAIQELRRSSNLSNDFLEMILEFQRVVGEVDPLMKVYQNHLREHSLVTKLRNQFGEEKPWWPYMNLYEASISMLIETSDDYKSTLEQFQIIQGLCYKLHQYISCFTNLCNLQASRLSPPIISRFSWTCLWVKKARRRLRDNEVLDAAIHQYAQDQDIQGDFKGPRTIAELIVDCWGFLTVDEDGLVGLVHPDLPEHIHAKRPRVSQEAISWKADEEIARRCLRLISHHLPSKRAEHFGLTYKGDHALCTYAFEYWHLHYREAESKSQVLPRMLHDMLQSSLFNIPSYRNERIWGPSTRELNQGLCFLAQYDLEILGRTYLEMGAEPNTKCSPYGATPLHVAVAHSASRMMHLLLTRGAEVDAVDCIGRSALHLAASVGFSEGVLLLMREGANVNSTTFLSFETIEQHDIVGPLFEVHGSRVCSHQSHSLNHGEMHAPQLAQKLAKKRSKTGCLTCRKRRIKCGEEKPICSNCIRSKRLCEGYNQRVIFKRQAQELGLGGLFDQQGPCREKTFYKPNVSSGHEAALPLVLQSQPRPGCRDSKDYELQCNVNKVPIYRVESTESRLGIARNFADITLCEPGPAQQLSCITPLHLAVHFKHAGIAKLLLRAGADMNIKAIRNKSEEGMTALEIAESDGIGTMAALLQSHNESVILRCLHCPQGDRHSSSENSLASADHERPEDSSGKVDLNVNNQASLSASDSDLISTGNNSLIFEWLYQDQTQFNEGVTNLAMAATTAPCPAEPGSPAFNGISKLHAIREYETTQ